MPLASQPYSNLPLASVLPNVSRLGEVTVASRPLLGEFLSVRAQLVKKSFRRCVHKSAFHRVDRRASNVASCLAFHTFQVTSVLTSKPTIKPTAILL